MPKNPPPKKIEILLTSISKKTIWIYGVPAKGSKEYGIEYLFFQITFRDKRRTGLLFYIDEGEVKLLKKAFRLAKKHYAKKIKQK